MFLHVRPHTHTRARKREGIAGVGGLRHLGGARRREGKVDADGLRQLGARRRRPMLSSTRIRTPTDARTTGAVMSPAWASVHDRSRDDACRLAAHGLPRDKIINKCRRAYANSGGHAGAAAISTARCCIGAHHVHSTFARSAGTRREGGTYGAWRGA